MNPRLFADLPTYGLFLVLAIVVGAGVAVFSAWREGVRLRQFLPGLFWALIGALLGSMIHSGLERGGLIAPVVVEILSGYRLPGGVIGCLIAVLACSPVRHGFGPAKVGDLLAPSIGFGIATVRVGCLLQGCCWGTPTNLPWAIRFPNGSSAWHAQAWDRLIPFDAPFSLSVHPLQAYLFCLDVALGLFALWLAPRKRYDGQVIFACLALLGFFKGALESLRGIPEPHVRAGSFLIGAAGAALLAWYSLRPSATRIAADG